MYHSIDGSAAVAAANYELLVVLPSKELLTALDDYKLPNVMQVAIQNPDDLSRSTNPKFSGARPLLLAEWRAETIPIIVQARYGRVLNPVIMVLCGSHESDPIAASALGVDEVIDWGANPLLLEARLLSRLRHMWADVLISSSRGASENPGTQQANTVTLGSIMLTPGNFRAQVDGRDLDLTPREYDLLALLIERQGECQSTDTLLHHIWHIEFAVTTNRVEVAVSGLRRKLKLAGLPHAIKTIRGRGYLVSGDGTSL
jgi:DNA-binding response OmpR family regulator